MGEGERTALAERTRANMRRFRAVLNKVESHLGCVECRGPVVDGSCPACDPEPVTV